MPASDYDARALALPIEDEERATAPSWSRRSSARSFARNSHTSQRGRSSLRHRVMNTYSKLNRRAMDQYNKLSPMQKVLVITGGILSIVLGLLFMVYNERIFEKLVPVADKWRHVRGGWVILWALIFTVSFPPLIGYSSLLTIAGFVYGFPNGYVPSLGPYHRRTLTMHQLVHSCFSHRCRLYGLLPPLPYHSQKLCRPPSRK